MSPFDRLTLRIDPEPDDDNEELEQIVSQLRDELLELDVETVDTARGEKPPEGAKVIDAIDWNTLIVTLAASGGVLTVLIGTVQSWLTRHERSSVTLEIDGHKLNLKGIPPDERQRTIDAWISRISGGKGSNG